MVAKSHSKKEHILTTAARLLATQGGVNFSMRTVADALEMRLSNLQYYFPTLEKLFSALIENFLLLGESKIVQAVTNEKKAMEVLIDLVCGELDDVYNCQLMWEIWALSERTEEARFAIALFYEQYIKYVAKFIKQQSAALNDEEIRRRAVMIVSLLEGVCVIAGKKRQGFELGNIKADLLQTINLIIEHN